MEIKSKDKLVHDVIKKFDERSVFGFSTYGTTLRDDVDDIHRWFNDVQEELMDAILYIQKVKEMTTEMLQEKLVDDYKEEKSVMQDKRYTQTDTANYMYNKISDYP